MKVEFSTGSVLSQDGKQLIIPYSEFIKAEKDDSEFESYCFATNAFFMSYGANFFLDWRNFKTIRKHLNRNGVVIITAVQERYTRNVYPDVFVSNDNIAQRIDLTETYNGDVDK